MKNRFLSAFAVLTLMLALSPASPASGEAHPKIRSAMTALEQARDQLQRAQHDFGGHRVDAIKAIDEAHHQLELCLQYDKR
jgi:hypothetical protein